MQRELSVNILAQGNMLHMYCFFLLLLFFYYYFLLIHTAISLPMLTINYTANKVRIRLINKP